MERGTFLDEIYQLIKWNFDLVKVEKISFFCKVYNLNAKLLTDSPDTIPVWEEFLQYFTCII